MCIRDRDGVRVGGRADILRGWGWQGSPEGKIVTVDGRPQYIDPVSYTHLDVYKRQKLDIVISISSIVIALCRF